MAKRLFFPMMVLMGSPLRIHSYHWSEICTNVLSTLLCIAINSCCCVPH